MPKFPSITPIIDLREHERQLSRALARGEKEIRRGQGYDLDAVLADADALLGESAE
jgi:hypothetical protein